MVIDVRKRKSTTFFVMVLALQFIYIRLRFPMHVPIKKCLNGSIIYNLTVKRTLVAKLSMTAKQRSCRTLIFPKGMVLTFGKLALHNIVPT